MTKEKKNGYPVPRCSQYEIPQCQLEDKFVEFVQWYATPKSQRRQKTLADFTRSSGIKRSTIALWKKDPGFWPLTQEFMVRYAKRSISDFVKYLYAHPDEASEDIRIFLRLDGAIINSINKKYDR